MRDKFSEFSIMRSKARNAPKGPRVTIAIGLISRDEKDKAIILATDSQMTFDDGSKDLNAKKLFVVPFQNTKVLMAYAGMSRPGLNAIETIREKASSVRVENCKQIHNTIQEAMREVRRSLCHDKDMSEERNFFLKLDNYFEFLIAYYFQGEPFLRHVDICNCSVSPVEDEFWSPIGNGKGLARYLFKEFFAADPLFTHPVHTAVSIIEKVKQNCDGCGGKTKVGLVFQSQIENFHSQADISPDGFVNGIIPELEIHERDLAGQRAKLLNQIIENANRAMEEKFKKDPNITVRVG